MKPRTTIVATVAAALAVAASVLVPRARPRHPAAAAATAEATPWRPAAGATVPEARYRLAFEQYVDAPGREPITILTQGTWITTPTADGHTAVHFHADAIDGPAGAVPDEAAASTAFELEQRDGVLSAIGFADDTSVLARRLLTGLATTLQFTARPQRAWTVVEEDLSGRYEASYARGDGSIERTRTRYTSLRGALGSAASGGVAPLERSRFVVDADGLVTADIDLDLRFELQPGVPPVAMKVRARLERAELAQVPASGMAMALAPIDGQADLDGAHREIDARLVAGASLEQLLVELRAIIEAGDHPSPERGRLLTRLAALVRIDPSVAPAIADQIATSADPVLVRVLAGALASTEVAAGTDALAGLMERRLDEQTRAQVVATLSLAEPVTDTSVAALRRGLDQASGDQALFGLATHERKIASREPALASAVVDELLARAARAPSEQRQLYVSALGNAGTARALPVLRAAIATDDRDLGSAAVFSLRFVPGDEADTMLSHALGRRELAFAAVRAIGYRDPARWRSVLAGLGDRFRDNARIQSEIQAILRRWG